MATVIRPRDAYPWLNIVEYPFEQNRFPTADGIMNYVDEGQGRPIVFVHGAPLWSFCWRHLVKGLRRDYRCIAPDHLGFGLSEKYEDVDYSPPAHSHRFGLLMDRLGVEDATLVVHDYGGPIGIDWALQNPGRVREIVIFNSWLWSLREDRVARSLYRIFNSTINRAYYRVLPAGPAFFLPVLFADRYRVPRFTREQYLMPFAHHRERQAPYSAARDLVRYSPWYESLGERAGELRQFATQLIWGMEDSSLGESAIENWQNMLPDVRVSRLTRAARYAMDDMPMRSYELVRAFIS